MSSDRAMVCRKSEAFDDWYVIEFAEHDNVMELRSMGGGVRYFYSSARVSDADVEGNRAEMLVIAEAIEKGESVEFYRCAAEVQEDGSYRLYSPRNNWSDEGIHVATRTAALDLAASIRQIAGTQ